MTKHPIEQVTEYMKLMSEERDEKLSAVAWLHLVAASTAMLAKSQWMDWSTVSSPQSGTCREPGSMITSSTVAIGPVSECGESRGPVGLEV